MPTRDTNNPISIPQQNRVGRRNTVIVVGGGNARIKIYTLSPASITV
jgi:hypothetical protein